MKIFARIAGGFGRLALREGPHPGPPWTSISPKLLLSCLLDMQVPISCLRSDLKKSSLKATRHDRTDLKLENMPHFQFPLAGSGIATTGNGELTAKALSSSINASGERLT